jgi:truncated hemoglobin YjbI
VSDGARLLQHVLERFLAIEGTNSAQLQLFFRNPAEERANQKRFFEEWLGGAAAYGHYKGIHARHHTQWISKRNASTWLRHFKESLAEAGVRSSK